MRTTILIALGWCTLAQQIPAALAQEGGATDTAPGIAQVINRDLTILQENSRSVVRLSAREGDGLAILADTVFSEGVIELEARGEDAQGMSFVGVAFHVQNDSTYEAVYLRPFNFRTPDPVRQRRGVQYISHPMYPWHRLREESPGKYEAAVQPPPDPNGWVRLRVVVGATEIHVYAGEGAEPDLVVERLGDRTSGGVGFWVGNGSSGDFASLRITPVADPHP
jgi:hypothetical protein